MKKELLFQELVDKNVVTLLDLLHVANIPSIETFIKGNTTFWKKIVDKKYRDVAEAVFSDYFSNDDDLYDNGMFLIYINYLKQLNKKICNLNIDNELFIKLKLYLQEMLNYDWNFYFECENLNNWIIESMNYFQLMTTKIHASLLTNLWNYLKCISNNQYQSHDLHLKMLQDYLHFNVDMMPSLVKFNFETIDNFANNCDEILCWINSFLEIDRNWLVSKTLTNNEINQDLYKNICLGKISLLNREINTFKIWYKIFKKEEIGTANYKNSIYMLKNVGLFLYEIVSELISKPNINL